MPTLTCRALSNRPPPLYSIRQYEFSNTDVTGLKASFMAPSKTKEPLLRELSALAHQPDQVKSLGGWQWIRDSLA
jgi:hypothetical protein